MNFKSLISVYARATNNIEDILNDIFDSSNNVYKYSSLIDSIMQDIRDRSDYTIAKFDELKKAAKKLNTRARSIADEELEEALDDLIKKYFPGSLQYKDQMISALFNVGLDMIIEYSHEKEQYDSRMKKIRERIRVRHAAYYHGWEELKLKFKSNEEE